MKTKKDRHDVMGGYVFLGFYEGLNVNNKEDNMIITIKDLCNQLTIEGKVGNEWVKERLCLEVGDEITTEDGEEFIFLEDYKIQHKSSGLKFSMYYLIDKEFNVDNKNKEDKHSESVKEWYDFIELTFNKIMKAKNEKIEIEGIMVNNDNKEKTFKVIDADITNLTNNKGVVFKSEVYLSGDNAKCLMEQNVFSGDIVKLRQKLNSYEVIAKYRVISTLSTKHIDADGSIIGADYQVKVELVTEYM